MSHKKILIVGPAWIGDMVMAQSLFKLLKQIDPSVVIDVLAPPWTFSLLSCMEEISTAIPLPFARGELKLLARYKIARALKAKNYDQAIVLPNSFKSALIPFLAGIPKRTGWLGEFRYILLNDIRHLDKNRFPLMVERFLALGLGPNALLPKDFPYPEFKISSISGKNVIDKFNLTETYEGKEHQHNRPILGLGVGAAYGPAKRWPIEYFAEVANKKIKEGWSVWLFGSKEDKPLTQIITHLTKKHCHDFSGQTELSDTLALLSMVSGVITNDSGLMHMAAALKKPLVALYGSTSPTFTPPLSKTATILKLSLACQPCFKRVCPLNHFRCMRELTPDRVLTIMGSW